jgi:uncharacterized membrane protein YgdD (TMEM256/DUF423 family)
MHKNFLIAGTLFGGLAVALGAFGAHGLQKITQDEKVLQGFQTGVQYQVYHALALLAVGVLYEKISTRSMLMAGYSFIIGIILFSGSLYLLTLLKVNESSLIRYVGPVTPLGGLLFIAGWLLLVAAVIKKKKL